MMYKYLKMQIICFCQHDCKKNIYIYICGIIYIYIMYLYIYYILHIDMTFLRQVMD